MISVIGLSAAALIYAWYLGLELADAKTDIETWISHSSRGERL